MNRFSRALLACLMLYLCPSLALGQKQSTPDAIEQYRAAVALQNQQLFDLAATEWRTFLEKHGADPLVAEATHYLGICHFQQRRYEAAVTAFRQAAEAKPSAKLAPAIQLNLGLAQYNLARAGDPNAFRQAVATLQGLLDRRPRSQEVPTAAFYLAESLVGLDQQHEAIKVYERALELDHEGTQRERLLYGLAVACQEQSQPRRARQRLEQLLRQFPTSPLAREATVRLGDIAFAADEFDEALRIFSSLSTNNTDELADYVLARRGACLFELEKYDDAAKAYTTVVQRFPRSDHYTTSLLAAGKCYYSAGAMAQARKWLTQVAESEDAESEDRDAQLEAVHWLAQAELKSDNPQEAIQVLTRAMGQTGKDQLTPQLKLDLADALFEMSDRQGEAAELYASVARESKDHALAPYALYMSAFAQLELKQYAAAIQAAEKFARRFDEHDLNTDVMAILAECQYQERDFNAAGKQWQQLCDRYPDRTERNWWVVRRALCHERVGSPNDVLDWLRPRVRQLADEPLAEAVCLVGNAFLQLDQPNEAVRVLSPLVNATQGKPNDQAILLLAKAEQARGKTRQARAAYARLIQEFPKSELAVDAKLQLAELEFAAGQYAAAAAKYGQLARHADDDQLKATALLGLAWSQQNQGQQKDATQTLAELIAEFPQLEEARQARYALSVALQEQEKYNEALAQLKIYLSTELAARARADALFVRGTCQAALKQFDQAIDSFRQVNAADRDYPDRDKVLYELAWAYQSAGKEQQATRAFQRLGQQYPRSELAAEAYYRVAEAAYTGEEYDDARSNYHIALASASERPEIALRAQHKIAWSLYQLRKYKEAEAAFREQLGRSPDGDLADAANWMVGECAYRQGHYREALEAFGRAANTGGGEDLRPLGLLHAGQAAAHLKKWPESLKFHERCLHDHPNSVHQHQARYGRAWALQHLDQPKPAQVLYAQVADETSSVVGARARFMLGELQFAEKNYDLAIRTYFKVAYGYGHPESPIEYHQWQADALFEAARCCESTARFAAAVRLYQELVQRYPTSDKFDHAQRKLASLKH